MYSIVLDKSDIFIGVRLVDRLSKKRYAVSGMFEDCFGLWCSLKDMLSNKTIDMSFTAVSSEYFLEG